MANVLLQSQTKRKGISVLEKSCIGDLLDNVTTALLENHPVEHVNYHAVKLIENDKYELEMHPEMAAKVKTLKLQLPQDIFRGILRVKSPTVAINLSPAI